MGRESGEADEISEKFDLNYQATFRYMVLYAPPDQAAGVKKSTPRAPPKPKQVDPPVRKQPPQAKNTQSIKPVSKPKVQPVSNKRAPSPRKRASSPRRRSASPKKTESI